jgi:hypothetical protein
MEAQQYWIECGDVFFEKGKVLENFTAKFREKNLK